MDFYNHLIKYFPEELVEKLKNNDGHEYKGLFLNDRKLYENQLLAQFPRLVKHTDVRNGYLFERDDKSISNSPFYELGCYYIQDPSAMLVGELLPINEDDLILDMCAAPGGKTIEAALRAKKGTIISNDSSFTRAKILATNVSKLGLGNVIVTNEDYLKKSNIPEGAFDKVILDAPCSGSAMFFKDKKMEEDWSIEKVHRCASIQKELIEVAYRTLKTGGYLIYSTCSLSYEEDEAIILDFIKDKNIELIDLSMVKGSYSHPSLPQSIHLYPFAYPGEGQFICLMKKLDNVQILDLMKKNKKTPDSIRNSLLDKYNLNERYNVIFNGYLSSLPYYMNYSYFNVIRLGITVCEDNGREEPSFHLARFLNSSNSYELNENEYKSYLEGLSLENKNSLVKGYYLLSYKGLNLAFGYVRDNGIKNLYPKTERKIIK